MFIVYSKEFVNLFNINLTMNSLDRVPNCDTVAVFLWWPVPPDMLFSEMAMVRGVPFGLRSSLKPKFSVSQVGRWCCSSQMMLLLPLVWLLILGPFLHKLIGGIVFALKLVLTLPGEEMPFGTLPLRIQNEHRWGNLKIIPVTVEHHWSMSSWL